MAKVEKEKKEKKHFFKDFKAELKKVIVLLTAAIVFVLDLTFETLNTQGVNRLKGIVQVNEIENNVDENVIDDHNDITQNTTITEQNTVPEV